MCPPDRKDSLQPGSRLKRGVAAAASRKPCSDPADIGQLLRDLDTYEGFPSITAFLRILPYVFTRPSELLRAEWSEFNFTEAVWRIPASRMKMCRQHTVLLSLRAISKLEELRAFSGSGKYLFPSVRAKTVVISDAGPLGCPAALGI